MKGTSWMVRAFYSVIPFGHNGDISQAMDAFYLYLASFRRHHPGPPPLASLGWAPGKRGRIRHAFPSLNFSFVMAGSGDYIIRGRGFPVEAPMVITQWPDEPMDYGASDSWDELYLIYAKETEADFRRSGLFDRGRPCWRMGEAARVRGLLDELIGLVRGDPARDIDRIDRLAEQAVLESVLATVVEVGTGGPAAAVEDLRRRIEADPGHPPDVDAVARRHGLSGTHLRRLWQRRIGVPPARFAMQLRLRRAARLLVDGEAPVAEIAARVGFDDPLHFSRRFSALFGIPPTEHRENWKRTRMGIG
jgi:AraC-like DNA-binding protein